MEEPKAASGSKSFQALNQRRTFEQILVEIEQAIVDGQLEEGDRLPSERELAEQFGVGRSSVREAMRVLEMFGVVVARRGSGAESGSVVAAGAADGLASALRLHSALGGIPTDDFVDLRVVLECHAARGAAGREASDRAAGVLRLRGLVDEMTSAALREPSDTDHFHRVDTQFHVELATVSGNALAPALMQAMRGAMSREMLHGWEALGDEDRARERSTVIAEHGTIVDAVEAGDEQRASDVMREHILRFYRQVSRSV